MTDVSGRRALFLAATAVALLLAVGVAFSGSAAAEVTSIDGVTAEDTTAGDTDQVETVTLNGVNKTNASDSGIEVVISDADVSVESASVTDSGDFNDVSASVAGPDFEVTISDDGTPNSDITVEVTLNTTNAESGTTGTYTATSNEGASASGDFQIQADDDGTQSDGVLTVDKDGDGAYDTIQAAIDNAESGDTVEVTSGDYDEQIIINRNDDANDLTIQAADGASPTIRYSANDGTPAVAIDQDDVTLEGFTIERDNSEELVAQAVRVAGDDVQLTNNTYQLGGGANSAAVAVLTDSSGAAGGPDVSGVTISDVTISGGEVITNTASQTGVLVADNGAASFGGAGSVSVSDVTFTANADSTQVLELDTGGGVVETTAVFNNNDFDSAAVPEETASNADINGFSIDGLISTTIQDAVNNAASGETVHIDDGNYTEQIVINKPVTLTGAGEGQTIIKSPTDLDSIYTRGDQGSQYPVVTVNETSADIEQLTVDGVGQGNGNSEFYGIHYRNAGGTVSDVTVTDVRNSPFAGAQHGISVAAFNFDGADRTVTLSDSKLINYQKNGFIGEGSGLTARVIGTNITGAGPTSVNGQNGVQISDSAVGEIQESNISGNIYTGDQPAIATNIILFNHNSEKTTVVQNNNISNGQAGIAVSGSPEVDINNNQFANNTFHIADYTGKLDSSELYDNNRYDRATYVINETGASKDGTVYDNIQSAISSASDGDTVSVESGTYNESVEINTQDITLAGPNAGTPGDVERSEEAIIRQGVKLNASGVTLDGFQVETNGTNGVRIGPEVVPDDVTIQNNVITNVGGGDFLRNNEPAGAGNGIQVQFNNGEPTGETAENLRILNNEINNVTTLDTPGRTTAVGINILPRGNDVELNITGNTITDIQPGNSSGDTERSRAISVDTQFDGAIGNGDENSNPDNFTGRAVELVISDNEITDITSGDRVRAVALFEDGRVEDFRQGISQREGPEDFVIADNEFDDISAPGGFEAAVFIGGYNDLGDHAVSGNNIEEGAIFRFAEPQEGFSVEESDDLNAVLNWWGEDATPRASDDVIYDPLLTVPREQASDNIDDVRNYGSYIELEVTDGATLIGFPAPSEDSLGELLDEDIVEAEDGSAVQAFVYDNADGEFESIDGSFTPTAGEVIAITTEDGLSDEFVVPVETDPAAGVNNPGQTQLGLGYNLVAGGAANDVDEFGVVTSDPGNPIIEADVFQTQARQPGAPEATFGAYSGTWILTSDGTLSTGYNPNTPPSVYFDEVLVPAEDNEAETPN